MRGGVGKESRGCAGRSGPVLPALALRSRLLVPFAAVAIVLVLSTTRAPVSPRIVVIRLEPTIVTTASEPDEPAPEPAADPTLLGVRGRDSTVVAWSEQRLYVSHTDGTLFRNDLEGTGAIAGAEIGADGTLFVVWGDRLLVDSRDSGISWRALPFGSWPDWGLAIDEIFLDGEWLGIVADGSVALTRDEGRTWRVLAIRGEHGDYAQHAAVIGGTLITTGGRYGFEGEDSTIQRRSLDKGRERTRAIEYFAVDGIGHDGALYGECAGNVCGDEDHAAMPGYDTVRRGPGSTFAVRGNLLLSLRGGREHVEARDVPDGFALTGVDDRGRVLGLDPARGLVRWSPSDGWQLLSQPA